jgi:antirestriction protein ArdC
MTAKFDIYQDVTDRIIAAIEAGTMPWLRPWTGSKATGLGSEPYNAFSGRAYNGINWLILGCQPYLSKGWLTYKQAAELGGNVRKGEKGTPIVFWSFLRDKDDPKKVIPFARGYTVFNVEQCEGLSAKVKAPTPAVPGDTSITALAARVGATVRHGGNSAFYAPTPDHIVVPSVDAFQSQEAYDATLAHELVHWTGHKSRCDRQFGKRFGDDAYAFEELVAEIGSAFVCAHQGVALEGLQHAAYVNNWLSVLKQDKRAIFTAASAAKKAAEFLIGKAEEVEEEVKEAA